MLQFQCVVPSEQNCDLSTGQGERASFQHPVAVGHLKNTVGLGNKGEGDNKRFILFISFNS